MKQLIAQQVQFILLMTMSGMAVMAGYDVLRLIRWLFPHDRLVVAVEDIFYWIIVSVPVFYLFLLYHDGIIRWYGLVAVFGGILLYEYGFSRPVRSRVAGFFNRLRSRWRKKRIKIQENRRRKRERRQKIREKRRKMLAEKWQKRFPKKKNDQNRQVVQKMLDKDP